MSELYKLPDGWEWKTLDNFTNCLKVEKRVPKGYKLSNELTPYPYIRVTDFNNHSSVDTNDIRYISEEIYLKIKNYTITDKDIYISVAGTIGKTGIIPSELNGANLTENAVKIVFDNELYDKNFLLNFTNSIIFIEQVGLATKTVAMPKLAIARLNKVLIPLPPLQEQKRIVKKLDNLFDKIDKAIALHQKNIDDADVFMASVLNDVFEELEEKYELKTIKEISNIISGYAFKSGGFSDSNEIKSIKITNVGVQEFIENNENKLSKELLKNLSKYTVSSGDIVIALTRPYISNGLKVTLVPKTYDGALVNQRVASIQAKENISVVNYIYHFLCTASILSTVMEVSKTLNQPNLSIKDLSNFKIPLPPLNIQQKTVKYLDEVSSKIDTLKQVQKEKMQSLKDLKSSILDQAFRGKL